MEHHAPSIGTLIAPTINLVVLVAFLGTKLKAPLGEFIKARSAKLKEEIHGAGEQIASARQQFTEYSAKLSAMSAEVAALKSQVREDAELTKTKMVTDAKALSKVIVSDAKTRSEQMLGDLKRQLVSELGVKVVEKAEGLLKAKVTGDDRVRLRKEFSSEVETAQ